GSADGGADAGERGGRFVQRRRSCTGRNQLKPIGPRPAIPLNRVRPQEKPRRTARCTRGMHRAPPWPPPTRSAVRNGCRGCAAYRSPPEDRKSTRLNSSHVAISYAVFCLKKKTNIASIHMLSR